MCFKELRAYITPQESTAVLQTVGIILGILMYSVSCTGHMCILDDA